MSIRTDLISAVTTAVNGSSVKVSSELPWLSGDIPLHEKNMKTIYFDTERYEVTEMFNTLDRSDVYQTETIVNAYLTVDAKNQPSDMQTILTSMLGARYAILGQFLAECSMDTDIDQDRITYTFEYRFTKVN